MDTDAPGPTPDGQVQGIARFPEFLQNYSERQILSSSCLVGFHALALKYLVHEVRSFALSASDDENKNQKLLQ